MCPRTLLVLVCGKVCPDSLFARDEQHTCKALMRMGCQGTFGHTVVSAVSKTTLLKAVQTNLMTVLSSAREGYFIKSNLQRFKCRHNTQEGENAMGFKKFFDFLHLVKMKRAGHFYYFYDDSPDTTKKTHSGFQ